MTRYIPILFVLIWSTGFIAARYAMPFIEPFNVLFIRMLLTLAVFAGLIAVMRPAWSDRRVAGHQMLVGALIHAAYLGGVFSAIDMGLPAGITSLLVGLQPILTAVISRYWFGDTLLWRQVLGLSLSLMGISLVLLAGKQINTEFPYMAVVPATIALIGISFGTVYQKRFGGQADLLTGSFYQYLSTALIMGLLTWQFETGTIVWNPTLIISLLWMVFGLSLLAILLLMVMIRHGEMAKVAAYFYLVPPLTAIEAWLLFNETLNLLTMAGVAICVTGVYLVVRKPNIKQAAMTSK
jgi:drug/metabolite transporter (DMT)-like permease